MERIELIEVLQSQIKLPRLNKDSYNKGVYKEAGITGKEMVTDIITMDEAPINEYIQEDKGNIVFIVKHKGSKGVNFFTTQKDHVLSELGSYECTTVDSASSFENTRLISLTGLGCPCAAFVNYYSIRLLLEQGVQVIFVKGSGKQSRAVMTHGARFLGDTYVSNAHCQDGTQQEYYHTYFPAHFMKVVHENSHTFLNDYDTEQSSEDTRFRSDVNIMLSVINNIENPHISSIVPDHLLIYAAPLFRSSGARKALSIKKRNIGFKPQQVKMSESTYTEFSTFIGNILAGARYDPVLEVITRSLMIFNYAVNKFKLQSLKSVMARQLTLAALASIYIAESINEDIHYEGQRMSLEDLLFDPETGNALYPVNTLKTMIAKICASRPDVFYMSFGGLKPHPVDLTGNTNQWYIYTPDYIEGKQMPRSLKYPDSGWTMFTYSSDFPIEEYLELEND